MSRVRFRYGISTLLCATMAVALMSALYRYDALTFWIALVGTVAANVIGVLFGWLITYVLRVPNDGSLSWRDEHESDRR